MLKHQQWRNEKYEERRKNYIEWIGGDTNHGQMAKKSMKKEGKTILSGLVRTPTTDNYILLVSLS